MELLYDDNRIVIARNTPLQGDITINKRHSKTHAFYSRYIIDRHKGVVICKRYDGNVDAWVTWFTVDLHDIEARFPDTTLGAQLYMTVRQYLLASGDWNDSIEHVLREYVVNVDKDPA